MKSYAHQSLVNLYLNKVKKDESYFKKYETLDFYRDSVIENILIGHDYPRVPCILDFKDWIAKYNIFPEKMLYTCNSDWELNYIKPKLKKLIEYNSSTNHGDLHTLSLEDKDYDFVLFSQTLEHLYNPFEAIKKIYEHVRQNGYVFTSVPSINIPHMVPFHFSGIYPMGLAVLFESIGFEVVEIGQWGNINYLNYIFNNHSWPDYEYLKRVGNGIIKNEEANIAQCWCLAKKI